MTKLISTINTWHLEHKRVLVRADLNVPLDDNGHIISDQRLRAIRPTLDLILEKQGTIILMTHLGRPQKPTPELSTKLLIPWFDERGYLVEYVPDIKTIQTKKMPEKGILLLENLRFFKGETQEDPSFAKTLAQLGDYYVNDAFASLHRNHASLTILATLFSPDKRSIGLLIEREIKELNKLLYDQQHPFAVIVGGGKVSDKLSALEALLPQIDHIFLGPAAVFSFLKVMGKPVGKSLIDLNALEICKQLLEKAQKLNKQIIVPLDYVVAHKTFSGPLSLCSADTFAPDGVGITIGPKTAQQWSSAIKNAKTIFYVGLMGDVRRKETLSGVQTLFIAMTQSSAFTVISGGDSVAAAEILNLADAISFCSTGGGATIAYLAHKKLPGLEPFL